LWAGVFCEAFYTELIDLPALSCCTVDYV